MNILDILCQIIETQKERDKHPVACCAPLYSGYLVFFQDGFYIVDDELDHYKMLPKYLTKPSDVHHHLAEIELNYLKGKQHGRKDLQREHAKLMDYELKPD